MALHLPVFFFVVVVVVWLVGWFVGWLVWFGLLFFFFLHSQIQILLRDNWEEFMTTISMVGQKKISSA